MWPFKKKEKKTKKQSDRKKKHVPYREEHNFDKDLSDEEFFEIMEDD